MALAALGAAMCGIQYVKVGLLGTRSHGMPSSFFNRCAGRYANTARTAHHSAAAYADAHKVNAMPPLVLPAVAKEAGVDELPPGYRTKR